MRKVNLEDIKIKETYVSQEKIKWKKAGIIGANIIAKIDTL